jgi:hypothetical protein
VDALYPYDFYVAGMRIGGEDYTAKIVVGKRTEAAITTPIDSNRKRETH